MSFLQEQRALAKCLNRLKSKPVSEVLADEEFRLFHKHRNKFNDFQVTKLIEQAPYKTISPIFKDNLGRIWREETVGVAYHTDKWSLNPFKILSDEGQTLRKWGREKKNRYSRKFLLESPLPGYEGTAFEMIIKRNGTRIISGEKMETFNFGESTLRSSISGKIKDIQLMEAGLHYKFDIAPHLEYGYMDYMCYPANPVRIVDMIDLYDSGDLDLKSLFS